jgi:hypothetical protein
VERPPTRPAYLGEGGDRRVPALGEVGSRLESGLDDDRLTALGGLVERHHDVEDVEGELAGDAFAAPLADRLRELGDAGPATERGAGGRDRLGLVGPGVEDRVTLEHVRVGEDSGALGARSSFESKLKTLCALAPFSNWMSAVTFVGTSTGKTVPAFGPEPITRVSCAFEAAAVTFATGPKTCTRVVR